MPVAVEHATERVMLPVPHGAEHDDQGPAVHMCRCWVEIDGAGDDGVVVDKDVLTDAGEDGVVDSDGAPVTAIEDEIGDAEDDDDDDDVEEGTAGTEAVGVADKDEDANGLMSKSDDGTVVVDDDSAR